VIEVTHHTFDELCSFYFQSPITSESHIIYLKMSEVTITGFRSRDVRFPTSLDKTGSDAMNAAGDYSAAYCILETDSKHSGHGMVSAFNHVNFALCES
jgi:hypothetical protein